MPIKSVLFIDIPELKELTGIPEDFILETKWKAEDVISGKDYARHMASTKYSRGLLTIASYIRERGISPAYISINDVSKDNLQKRIAKAEAIGLPASNTPFIPKVTEITALIKRVNPKILVIVGGYHATFQDKELLKEDPNIDIVVRGEGEKTFYDILKNYPKINEVRGITFRKGKKIIRNPNRELLPPEEIPLPAYDLLPHDINNYSIKIQTTRGCPFRCSFCVNPVFWRKVRAVPPKEVIKELLQLGRKLKPKTHIHFTDNIFTWNKKRAIEICREIRKKEFPFSFSCDVRGSFLDKETLEAMKKANFTQIMIGFEDVSDKILEVSNKRLTYEQCIKTAQLIKKHSNIIVTAYWIVGLPGLTHRRFHEDLAQIRNLLRENIVDIVNSALLVPVPGTPIFEKPNKFGASIVSRNWDNYFRCRIPAVYRLKKLDEKQLANYYLLFETTVLMEYCRRLKMTPHEISSL